MFGILNINKPVGWTSRDVVNRVERLVRPAKAGHAGTLDPIAGGVLVVCVGPATRLIEYAQRMPKHYRGTFRLGCQSPSDDTEGEVTPLPDAPRPSLAEVEAALPQFVGQIAQRPPVFSAIKIGGKRSYKLARKGRAVELPTRQVTIHRLAVVQYDYPQLVIEIVCGSGTYVRALGRDLAESLGTAAVMTALERTAIGPFHIAEAVDPDDLTAETIAQHLQSPLSLLSDMPRLELTSPEVEEIRHGRFISPSADFTLPPISAPGSARGQPTEGHPTEVAAVDPQGRLVALLIPKPGDRWAPKRNFSQSE